VESAENVRSTYANAPAAMVAGLIFSISTILLFGILQRHTDTMYVIVARGCDFTRHMKAGKTLSLYPTKQTTISHTIPNICIIIHSHANTTRLGYDLLFYIQSHRLYPPLATLNIQPGLWTRWASIIHSCNSRWTSISHPLTLPFCSRDF